VRRILAISLIAILFANVFGYLISFTVQRNKIKEEVKQLIKAEKLKHTQQFAFTEQEYRALQTVENGKEFILNGGLYDVVKKERKDSKIILTAYYDHAETGLIGKFLSYFNDTSQTDAGKHIVPVFCLLEFVFQTIQSQRFDTVVSYGLTSYSSNLLTLSLASATPPPDSLFS
jgi:hypothetical protein